MFGVDVNRHAGAVQLAVRWRRAQCALRPRQRAFVRHDIVAFDGRGSP
jgi:hypothetical protein